MPRPSPGLPCGPVDLGSSPGAAEASDPARGAGAWHAGGVLSHDEERSLAALEAQLDHDDPQLAALLAGAHPSTMPRPPSAPAPSLLGAVVRTALAVAATLALTAVTTALLGPNAGGFVGALGLPLAGLYGWRQLGACPARR